MQMSGLRFNMAKGGAENGSIRTALMGLSKTVERIGQRGSIKCNTGTHRTELAWNEALRAAEAFAQCDRK